MIKIVVLIGLIYFSILTFGQNKNAIRLLDIEYSININNFQNQKNGINGKTGFGASIYRIWFTEKKYNLISGLVFNKLTFFDDYVKGGRYYDYENITFNIFSFSIPLFLRYNFGRKYKLFIESGPLIDIVPLIKGKGIKNNYTPFPPYYTKDHSTVIENFDHDKIKYGINIGTGLIFPIKNFNPIMGLYYHKDCKFKNNMDEDILLNYFILKLLISFHYSKLLKK